MKKNKKNLWADHYTYQAKKDKYPARSVYKLKEIQKKYRLIKQGNKVLDLGCAPGSWLIFVSEILGSTGFITGIDQKKITIKIKTPHEIMVDDIYNVKDMDSLEGAPFDIVLSDMAPNTTGRKDVDALRSLQLSEVALDMAQKYLRPGGHFVCKIFQGSDTKEWIDAVKACFKSHQLYRPKTTRKASKEIYIIGLGMKSPKKQE
ncbi:Ribosomal RNA large subunit methyltransferase E [Candidatus Magnetomorum sp. HK-1]|nr:Ribosomal RNA large subunit methyltransferase E [Candidatus Magnetomorum sp. HK-1]